MPEISYNFVNIFTKMQNVDMDLCFAITLLNVKIVNKS